MCEFSGLETVQELEAFLLGPGGLREFLEQK